MLPAATPKDESSATLFRDPQWHREIRKNGRTTSGTVDRADTNNAGGTGIDSGTDATSEGLGTTTATAAGGPDAWIEGRNGTATAPSRGVPAADGAASATGATGTAAAEARRTTGTEPIGRPTADPTRAGAAATAIGTGDAPPAIRTATGAGTIGGAGADRVSTGTRTGEGTRGAATRDRTATSRGVEADAARTGSGSSAPTDTDPIAAGATGTDRVDGAPGAAGRTRMRPTTTDAGPRWPTRWGVAADATGTTERGGAARRTTRRRNGPPGRTRTPATRSTATGAAADAGNEAATGSGATTERGGPSFCRRGVNRSV